MKQRMYMESRGTPFLLHLQRVKQDYIIVPTLPFPVHSALPLTDLDHAPAQNHEHSPAERPKQPIIFTSSRHLVFPGTFFAFLFFLPNDKRNLHLTHDFFPDLMQQGPPLSDGNVLQGAETQNHLNFSSFPPQKKKN